jgi:hypothetical protein
MIYVRRHSACLDILGVKLAAMYRKDNRLRAHSTWKWFVIILVCAFLWGCAARPAHFEEIDYPLPQKPPPLPQLTPAKKPPPQREAKLVLTITERVVTEQEIQKIGARDPQMTRVFCLEILARLNGKARNYIIDDIKKKQRIKAPTDFFAYRNWTPLPRDLVGRIGVPKLILIVKDIPFIGWYENSRLKGDDQICIGKMMGWTHTGLYAVEQKDQDHISQSYTNAYGQPAFMPFALRIYGRVWIHAGDVTGGYCSHGCINLTMDPAESLFNWADIGTPVLIVDSLNDLDKNLKKYSGLNPKANADAKTSPPKIEKKQLVPDTPARPGMNSRAAPATLTK